MTESEKLVCPAHLGASPQGYCLRGECAWWDGWAQMCAVRALGIGMWRLSAKVPGNILDGADRIAVSIQSGRTHVGL